MTLTPSVAPAPQSAAPVWTLLDQPLRIHVLRAIAVLAGVVIPLLVIGRGAAAILVPVIGGMLAAAIYWPRGWRALKPALRQPLTIALAAMFLLWLPSVAFSLKPGYSFAIWLQVLGLVLFMPSLASVLREHPALHAWTLRLLLVMAVACSGIAAISLTVWPEILEFVRPVTITSATPPVSYLKSFAAVMPCLAPILLWGGYRLGGWWRGVALAGVALGLVVVFAANNRAALGGYAGMAVFVCAALALRRAPRPLRLGVLGVALAGAAAIVAYVVAHLPPVPFQGFETLRLPTGLVDAHRQVIWSFVLERAAERPWFGWGPSMANFLPGADDPIPEIGQTYVPLHAHNWLVQIFNDVGRIGLAAALAALGVFLLHLDRRYRTGQVPALAALGLSGAFFVSTLANFSIWQGWWQSVFAVLLPIALAGAPPHLTGAHARR